MTPQRLLVADALDAAGRQMTAEELWDRVRARQRGIGRATVFRTLDALIRAGAARRLERPGHIYAYVACDVEHHHHLSCTSCGRVEEIDESYIRPVADLVATDRGFVIDDAQLDFYGRCAQCRAGSR